MDDDIGYDEDNVYEKRMLSLFNTDRSVSDKNVRDIFLDNIFYFV